MNGLLRVLCSHAGGGPLRDEGGSVHTIGEGLDIFFSTRRVVAFVFTGQNCARDGD